MATEKKIMQIVDNPTSDVALTHPFKDRVPDVDEFFQADNGVGVINTINSFCNRVKKLAAKYALVIDESDFKGWSLELLVEYFAKSNDKDNRFGIYNYKPVTDDDSPDVGVDGSGIGENGNRRQFKSSSGLAIMFLPPMKTIFLTS